MPVKTPRAAGRPPAFDRDRALERAMRVFWRKGFEGASLIDLTSAMAIRPPSLYAAFGNKQALFEEALGRYLTRQTAFMKEALDEPTAYRAVEQMLRRGAEFLTRPGPRCGCMTVESALVGGSEGAPIRRKLTQVRLNAQNALQRRLERAQSEGDLPKTANPADLARFIFAIVQGMTVQSINGATRPELLRLGEMALQAWPHCDSRERAQ